MKNNKFMGAIWGTVILLAIGLACGGHGTKLEFNGGELFYTKNVTEAEARGLGEYFVKENFFDGRKKSVQLDKSGSTYQVRMVILPEKQNDQATIQGMSAVARELSANVFGRAPTEVHMCDENLKTLRVVNPDQPENAAALVGGENPGGVGKVNPSGTNNQAAPPDNFANGTYKGYARNRTTKQRADLTLALNRSGNDVTGSAFIGPPLRGSGTVTGRVIAGENVEMTLASQDVRQKWTIDISAVKTPEGGMEGTYTISNGQRGIFSVSAEK